MVSAKFLRDNLFPWYEKMGKVCNKRNIPFIYHSDGDISEIIDDLINCGFNAIHPIEPKAMKIENLKEKYSRKLCFLGNIEMDTLIRGTVDEVRNLVKKNLEIFAQDGFYGCGSSNTITEAMPVENVIAMCKAVRNM
jgi:uroporphyrinogen decarboxylase